MARTVLRDVTVTIGGVDYSNHVKSVAVTSNTDVIDITKFGDLAHVYAPGLQADEIEVEFYQDFAGVKHSSGAAAAPRVDERRHRRREADLSAVQRAHEPRVHDGRRTFHVPAARRHRRRRLDDESDCSSRCRVPRSSPARS
jgi:hypothetical protein